MNTATTAPTSSGESVTLLQVIFAFLFPPLSVFMHAGVGKQLLLNILLTMLGVLPGVLHAMWVLTKR